MNHAHSGHAAERGQNADKLEYFLFQMLDIFTYWLRMEQLILFRVHAKN